MEETARHPGEPQWELCFAAVYLTTVVIVEAGHIAGPGRIAASVALVAMIPWYLFAVRPLALPITSIIEPLPLAATVRALAALTVLIALSAVVLFAAPAGWLLAFALCPMCLRTAPGIASFGLVVIFNIIAFAAAARLYPELTLAALGAMLFAMGLTYVFGIWMRAVITQSEERGELITELSETRSQLAASHREAGVLAERQRLAGEIHDTLAQGFTSIVTLIQAASPAVEPGTQPRELLDLALTTARENLAEARALVTTLSPTQLDGSTLGDAITRAAQAAGGGSEAMIRSDISGVPRSLPTTAEVVLLRVAQEALANVRKHSGARRVDVDLHYADEAVALTVSDDGHGFNVDGVSGGFGLRGMRERIRQAGGTIAVESAPGEGTVVRAEVPA
jgi:signal transduction histidine kinase